MTTLHRDEFGSGEPAVFVHGSFGWGLDTFPAQRSLADAYRVLLVDRVGYGGTPRSDAGSGWPADVPELIALLSELGTSHLVGQSYGAVVALATAGQRPDLVRSLVVVEPPLYRLGQDDPAVQPALAAAADLARRAVGLDTRQFVREWVTSVMGRPAESAQQWMSSWGPADTAAAETTRQERFAGDAPIDFAALRAMPCPKVVVSGRWHPDLFPGRHQGGEPLRVIAAILARRIAADRVEFARSAHNPQIEEPEAFNDLLRQVWQRISPVR